MNAEPVIVGGREIPAEAIAAEAQNHPAPDAAAAWNAAAEALAVRQLLLDFWQGWQQLKRHRRNHHC